MAAAVVLDFQFLTVGHAKKVEPLHCAKFRLNRSNPDRHMVTFYYSRWRLPPSLIFNDREHIPVVRICGTKSWWISAERSWDRRETGDNGG